MVAASSAVGNGQVSATGGPATGTATAPAQTPTPAQQLVHVLEPVRSGPEGTHQITLGLHPEELGAVKATVTVSAGRVVVELSAAAPAGREALRQAMGELRQQLAGDTGAETTVLLSDGQGSGRDRADDAGSPTTSRGLRESEALAATSAPTVTRPALDRLVDVRL